MTEKKLYFSKFQGHDLIDTSAKKRLDILEGDEFTDGSIKQQVATLNERMNTLTSIDDEQEHSKDKTWSSDKLSEKFDKFSSIKLVNEDLTEHPYKETQYVILNPGVKLAIGSGASIGIKISIFSLQACNVLIGKQDFILKENDFAEFQWDGILWTPLYLSNIDANYNKPVNSKAIINILTEYLRKDDTISDIDEESKMPVNSKAVKEAIKQVITRKDLTVEEFDNTQKDRNVLYSVDEQSPEFFCLTDIDDTLTTDRNVWSAKKVNEQINSLVGLHIDGIDVEQVGGNGKFISAISQQDGRIIAQEKDLNGDAITVKYEGQVGSLSEILPSIGKVKAINSIAPDESGNINVIVKCNSEKEYMELEALGEIKENVIYEIGDAEIDGGITNIDDSRISKEYTWSSSKINSLTARIKPQSEDSQIFYNLDDFSNGIWQVIFYNSESGHLAITYAIIENTQVQRYFIQFSNFPQEPILSEDLKYFLVGDSINISDDSTILLSSAIKY